MVLCIFNFFEAEATQNEESLQHERFEFMASNSSKIIFILWIATRSFEHIFLHLKILTSNQTKGPANFRSFYVF